MKATVDAAALTRVAEWAGRLVTARPFAPVLGAAVFTPDGDGLSMTAGDGDSWGVAQLPSSNYVDGERLAVPARLLADVAKSLPSSGPAELVETDLGLQITAGRHVRAVLPTMPAEDYPTVPAPNAAEPVEVPAVPFARAVEIAAKIADKSRVVELQQVRLIAEAGVLSVAGTDRWRLTMAAVPWSGPDVALTLTPAGAAQVAALAKTGERVTLVMPSPTEGTLTVGVPWRRLSVRLGAGTYPPLSQFMSAVPADARWIVADRAELARVAASVGRVGLERADSYRAAVVRLTVADGQLTLVGGTPANGRLTDGLDVEHDPAWDEDPWTVTLNAEFLSDLLAAQTAPAIRLTFAGPRKFIAIRPVEPDRLAPYGLFMPILAPAPQ